MTTQGCPGIKESSIRDSFDCFYEGVFLKFFDIELTMGLLDVLFYGTFILLFVIVTTIFSFIGKVRTFREENERATNEYLSNKADTDLKRNNYKETYKTPTSDAHSDGKARRDGQRMNSNDIYK